jgi:hypothetical protein
MSVIDKLNLIAATIKEIEAEDPGMAAILVEGFGLSLNLIETVSKNGARKEIDISEHLEVVSKILNVSIKDLVMAAMQGENSENDKVPDQDTLDFITSDLDDYEKFIAQNKAKSDLDFLSKSI